MIISLLLSRANSKAVRSTGSPSRSLFSMNFFRVCKNLMLSIFLTFLRIKFQRWQTWLMQQQKWASKLDRRSSPRGANRDHLTLLREA